MVRIFIFFCLLFVLATSRVWAAEMPNLKISVPEPDSVVSNTFKMSFDVQNFTLTAQPTKDPNAGLVAVYVDGKFFTNVATNSAQLYIPKIGTHLIEAELTNSSRESVVPRAGDSHYVYVQKKTPFLFVKNIRHLQTIYVSRPVLEMDYILSAYEDQETYYQVFVDGEVDGDSKDLADSRQYTLHTDLKEGNHSLRVVLYNSNDRPHLPTVDTQLNFVYSAVQPEIARVTFGNLNDDAVPFTASVRGFSIPRQGYLVAQVGDREEVFATTSGTLSGFSGPNREVRFALLGKDGREVVPATHFVETAPTVTLNDTKESRFLGNNGYFIFNDVPSGRAGFLLLAFVEAIMVVVLASFLAHRHHRTRTG